MLTNAGDTILDPFAGSCVTGMVAENLQRKWICIELSESYLHGAIGRFKGPLNGAVEKGVKYAINTPCTLPIDEATAPLAEDGGKTRPATKTHGSVAGTKRGTGLKILGGIGSIKV